MCWLTFRALTLRQSKDEGSKFSLDQWNRTAVITNLGFIVYCFSVLVLDCKCDLLVTNAQVPPWSHLMRGRVNLKNRSWTLLVFLFLFVMLLVGFLVMLVVLRILLIVLSAWRTNSIASSSIVTSTGWTTDDFGSLAWVGVRCGVRYGRRHRGHPSTGRHTSCSLSCYFAQLADQLL